MTRGNTPRCRHETGRGHSHLSGLGASGQEVKGPSKSRNRVSAPAATLWLLGTCPPPQAVRPHQALHEEPVPAVPGTQPAPAPPVAGLRGCHEPSAQWWLRRWVRATHQEVAGLILTETGAQQTRSWGACRVRDVDPPSAAQPLEETRPRAKLSARPSSSTGQPMRATARCPHLLAHRRTCSDLGLPVRSEPAQGWGPWEG